MSIIPSGLFSKYDEFSQHFLDDFGVVCTLVYNETIEVVQEEQSPLKGKKSIEVLPGRSGFSRGSTYFKTVEQTENITLRVYWTQDEFKRVANITLPDGSVVCYGLLSDLPKIERANSLIIHANATPDHRQWTFEKFGEPKIHGLTNKELISFWTRNA